MNARFILFTLVFLFAVKFNANAAGSDLMDYPGIYLQKQNGKIAGTWADYPSRVELGSQLSSINN